MRALCLAIAFLSSVAYADEITIIPIGIERGGNQTTVSIGDVRLRAVIDTSGYHSVGISPDALNRLNVRFQHTFVERIDGAGQRFRGREFVIPELHLGNGIFRDVAGFERHESADAQFGRAPFEVAIGREFLQRYRVIVDYPGHRIELHATGSHPVCGEPTGTIEPHPSGLMYSILLTDDGPLKLAWDTGSTYSLIQKRLAAERGMRFQDERYATHRLRLGSRELGPHRMVVLDLAGAPEIDGVLGSNFFAQHRVCFDYPARTISVR